MHRFVALLAGIVVLGVVAANVRADEKGDKNVPAALNFKMKTLDGKDVDLASYKGKVVLFVNVASQCGYTPQYKGLEQLHEKYSKDGLAIIGVPSNDFGQQEPGTNAEIAEFCQKNYGVKFNVLGKVTVTGPGQTPLYKFLTSNDANPVKWNFTKFLINRQGDVAGRFESKVAPESKQLIQAIEAELAKK